MSYSELPVPEIGAGFLFYMPLNFESNRLLESNTFG